MIILKKFKRKIVEKLYQVIKPYMDKDFLINEKPDYYVHKNDFNNPNIILEEGVLVDSTSVFKTLNNSDLIKVGKKTSIGHGVCLLTYGGSIEIGEDCDINPYSIICGHGKGTRIGNKVLIAPQCMIIPNNHIFKNPNIPIADQGNYSKGIIIKDDVWIGHGCSILDGVIIGKGAIIGAGSVVRRNVEDFEIYTSSNIKNFRRG